MYNGLLQTSQTNIKFTLHLHSTPFLNELLDIEKAQVATHKAYVRPTFARDAETIDNAENTPNVNATGGFDDVVDSIAKREMPKIARLFDDAIRGGKAVDAAIWDVCQRCIFPMVDSLDLKGTLESQQSAKSMQTADAESSAAQSGTTAEKDQKHDARWRLARLPSYIPPLSIISRLYPAALLLALRLFAKHSPTSPFALAILPQVRAQGPASYVLGGTTPFYNTLMKLQWDVYSNLKEIGKLLGEMEKGGIELDAETYQMLVAIGEERWADISRSEAEEVPQGARSKAWWERDEQVKRFQKVGIEWKQVIAARLREQGQPVSEREYGSVARGNVHDGEQTVWIG